MPFLLTELPWGQVLVEAAILVAELLLILFRLVPFSCYLVIPQALIVGIVCHNLPVKPVGIAASISLRVPLLALTLYAHYAIGMRLPHVHALLLYALDFPFFFDILAWTLLLGRCASLTQQAEAQPTVDLVAALRKVRPNKPKLGKRVAIVGNGPSVRGVGAKIDTFDEVVRFNHFWCGGDEMVQHRGSRTTVHFSNSYLFTSRNMAHVEPQGSGAVRADSEPVPVLPMLTNSCMLAPMHLMLRLFPPAGVVSMDVRGVLRHIASAVLFSPAWNERLSAAVSLPRGKYLTTGARPRHSLDTPRMYLTTGARPRHSLDTPLECTSRPARVLDDAGEVEEIVLVGFDGFKPGQPKHYFENFEPWHERVLGWFIEDLLKQSNHDPRSEQLYIGKLLKEGKVKFME
eukprot:CAMPEP_0185463708 /NCGR_PEP_ID=MMETSP1365-20130426/95364_1 /TAXON_ID=38817 /ORGANISM="Gephyrocapsa oceanica, Strain RCC1303" /LENGTH=401 /DNA_ID=CAMNT_0028070447 /DNA_START=146 /DNA_END=1351 /DNA_ORIENTATION=-